MTEANPASSDGMMNEEVKHDILSVLRSAVKKLKHARFDELKELSNHTIHNASIFQDPDSISLAVVIYALSKIAERKHHLDPSFLGILEDAIHDLESGYPDLYRKRIHAMFRKISELDSRLGLFIEEVVRSARIKKASKIYDHGISLAQTAELLGISQWELASYTGKMSSSEHSTPKQTRERIEIARRIFGLGNQESGQDGQK
ncbi:hypothetical protein D6764_03105 [Candidatus Woesearchaeota archaeon]|nr:MAG: hypothetical protein D6764_03105 [Candidatus Woesearchaeota archaeon]